MDKVSQNLLVDGSEHNRGIEFNEPNSDSFFRTNTFLVGLTIEISKFSLDDSLSISDQLSLFSLSSYISKLITSRNQSEINDDVFKDFPKKRFSSFLGDYSLPEEVYNHHFGFHGEGGCDD